MGDDHAQTICKIKPLYTNDFDPFRTKIALPCQPRLISLRETSTSGKSASASIISLGMAVWRALDRLLASFRVTTRASSPFMTLSVRSARYSGSRPRALRMLHIAMRIIFSAYLEVGTLMTNSKTSKAIQLCD
jgi:hypothetical protein